MIHTEQMRLAIKEAEKNLSGIPAGGPFGACIVKDGSVIAVARNTVLREDATCHAEINAIRRASSLIQSFDLSGCDIYSTTEPCPMCFSAIHWSRINRIFFGTTIEEAAVAGFNELFISTLRMAELGGSRVEIVSGILHNECYTLFEQWKNFSGKESY
ncbi:MAG: nucleoside deaminase [Candidatus Ratteibacteria bacterium]|jgi:guanine deaminase